MKRKVTRTGPSTLTVSLPSKWATKQGLKPGMEIEIIEEEANLLIKTEKKIDELEIFLDISGYTNMINRVLCAIYKAGFTKVHLKYTDSAELDSIHATLERTCHTFEIMNITKESVEIKNVSSPNPAEFDKIFRKLGQSINDVANDTLLAMRKNDIKQFQTNIQKDKLIDRHSDFCRRILNFGYPIPHKRPHAIYAIIEQLEILADLYKELNQVLIQESQITKDHLDCLSEINKLTRDLIDLNYKFDARKVIELDKTKNKVDLQLKSILAKQPKPFEIINLLFCISRTAFEMKSAILTSSLVEKTNIQ